MMSSQAAGTRMRTRRDPSASRRKVLPGDLCLYALMILVLFVQLIAFGANDSFLAVCAALAELALCILAVGLTFREDLERTWTLLTPVLLTFLGAVGLGAAPLLLNRLGLPHGGLLAPDSAYVELIKLAGIGGITLGGMLIARSRTRYDQFCIWLATAGLIYTLASLWLGQTYPLTVFGQSKGAHTFRFTGTLLNANAAGCLFGMIGLFSLGLGQRLFSQTDLRTSGLLDYLKLAIAGAGALAAFGACVLTQSRTSLLLSLILGAVLIGIDLWRRGQSGRTLGVASAIILLAGLGLGASQIVSRWSSVVVDAGVRADTYRHLMGAIGATPLFGFGLGGFKPFHESTLSPYLARPMWDLGAAHSAVLQAALEGGLPFVLLILAALALLVRGIFKRASRRELGPSVSSALAAAGLAGLSSFVDIALNVPAVAAFAMLLLGLSWGAANAQRTRAAHVPAAKRTFASSLGETGHTETPASEAVHG